MWKNKINRWDILNLKWIGLYVSNSIEFIHCLEIITTGWYNNMKKQINKPHPYSPITSIMET